MNITSEPAHLSLAQRIAKVRNCMLVEVSTGVSPTNKDLFVSLCRNYEQNSVVTSSLPGELHESLPHWVSSVSNSTQGTTQPRWPISTLKKSCLLWQQGLGFLVTSWADFSYANDFSDWNNSQ